jgi:plastocyanin
MRMIRLVLSMSAAVILAACGGGGGDSTAPPTNNNPTPPSGTSQTLGTISTSVSTMSLVAGDGANINVTALDTQGSVITSFSPTFTSQNAAIAEVSSSGAVFGIASGSTTINVSVTMGSVTKTTSVAVSVSGALKSIANIGANADQAYPSFTPDKVVIAVGGTVSWDFASLEHTVTFDGGGAGTPQNIPASYSTTVRRDFATRGNFRYHCTIHSGMSGEVVVR